MERFTFYENDKWCIDMGGQEASGPWVNRLADYENLGLSPVELRDILHSTAIKHSPIYERPWKDVLRLSTRAFNCLQRNEKTRDATIGRLSELHSFEIRCIRNLGVTTQREVAEELNRVGIYDTNWEK